MNVEKVGALSAAARASCSMDVADTLPSKELMRVEQARAAYGIKNQERATCLSFQRSRSQARHDIPLQ